LPHGSALLDRIPGGEHPSAKPPPAHRQATGQYGEFLWILERRIDQHQPALLARRQQRAERLPTIPLVHADLAVALEHMT
jgi:hypothetical protein